jgi:hypothetical protein
MTVTNFFSDGDTLFTDASFTLSNPAGTQGNPYIFGSYQGPGYYRFVGQSQEYYVDSLSTYNSYVNGTGGTGHPVTINGAIFYYYTGDLVNLVNVQGMSVISGTPIYFAWQGWQGAGYYWWQALNAISGEPLTLNSMFTAFNNDISGAAPLTSQ